MINQNRYIKITSGVGAGAAVAQRKLSLRVITPNQTLPPGIVVEFSSADAVATYFGTQSTEYARALKYFGFISKQIVSPDTISFSRFVQSAIPAMIVGDAEPKNITALKRETSGNITINYDGTPYAINSINLSTATTLTDVASLLQTAINNDTEVASLPALKTATVSFNTNTQQFSLTAGSATAGAGTISVTPTDNVGGLSQLLGWATNGTVFVDGQGGDNVTEAVIRSVDIDNNFGSFLFNQTLAQDDIVALSQWNDAQNNMYMFLFSVPFDKIAAIYNRIKGYSGTGMMIKSATLPEDYIDQAPAEILAATNYNRPNATQNYMYYQFADRNVTVRDDASADTADANRANYIGITQTAGQQLAFFQRGVLMGGPQDAVDMNIYANEMWMKSAITAKLFEMFLNLGSVPANADGEATILAMIQVVIDNAKINGVISVGKALTEIQKQYINQLSGDETAWRQVETIGYWITIDFEPEVTSDGRTEYYATYTLIYSKDDAIRRVSGRDVMI